METYWKDQGGDDESFWEHEWGKHGTCISTFNPPCYVDYTPQEEVRDFFQKTVDLFKTLDSYTFLAIAGIVPSTTQTYSSAQVEKALGAFRGGVNASIECGGAANNELQQIYYHFHVAGSAQDGIYVPTQPGESCFSLFLFGKGFLVSHLPFSVCNLYRRKKESANFSPLCRWSEFMSTGRDSLST